jgi:hypothetical protein
MRMLCRSEARVAGNQPLCGGDNFRGVGWDLGAVAVVLGAK